MLSNIDIKNMIAEIKSSCAAESHGGQLHYARTLMIEAGFFDCMPESTLDPFRPAPESWTAFQLAVFDNGERPAAKRKRNYIERTKTRYGGQIKMWTRDQINFNTKSQVAWQANVYFWDAKEAVQVAKELLGQKYIDQDTVDMMTQTVEHLGEGWVFAIPVLKNKESGSRWMKGHVLAIDMADGLESMVFIGPEVRIAGDKWSEQDAGGKDLADKVVAQMRIGINSGFDAWATQQHS